MTNFIRLSARVVSMTMGRDENTLGRNKMKCPTCGHVHPNGIGIAMCACDDCHLIWFNKPDLLSEKNAKRRKILMQKIEREQLKTAQEIPHGCTRQNR